MFPVRLLRNIVHYLCESFLFDNFSTIPTYPGDSKFDAKYYSKALELDLEQSGYWARRVDPSMYIEQNERRQKQMEDAEGAAAESRWTDDQWNAFWSKKTRAKEEMYLAIKQRAFGVSE